MTKIEFLSASLPYGLVIYDGYSYMQLYTVDVSNKYLFVKEGGCGYSRTFNESKPVIRHLDTLTQECVQADYNDGKPFIPIVELAWTYKAFVHQWNKANTEAALARLRLEDAMLLLRWHFWPNKPEDEEVVYVSDEFNPYK